MTWWLTIIIWYLELEASIAIGVGLAKLHTMWQDKKLKKKQTMEGEISKKENLA